MVKLGQRLGSCSCAKTIAVLKALGARHAAMMHAKGAASDPSAWSPADWHSHMAEEESLLFQHFPAGVTEKLVADHNIFRQQLASSGRVDPVRMRQHGALEERTIDSLF